MFYNKVDSVSKGCEIGMVLSVKYLDEVGSIGKVCEIRVVLPVK